MITAKVLFFVKQQLKGIGEAVECRGVEIVRYRRIRKEWDEEVPDFKVDWTGYDWPG